MDKKNQQHGSGGFSLFEILFVTAILATVAALSGGLITNLIVEHKRSRFKDEMSILRDTIKQVLEDQRAWVETMNANGGGPGSTNWEDFTPRVNAAALFPGYDWQTNPAIGFDMDGRVCNQFNPNYQTQPALNSALCPVRFEFRWRQVAGSCNNQPASCIPAIDIDIRAIVAFPPTSPYAGLSRTGGGDYAMQIRKTSTGRVWESNVSVFDQATALATSDPCGSTNQTVIGFDQHCRRRCGTKATMVAATTPPPPPPPPTKTSPTKTSPTK